MVVVTGVPVLPAWSAKLMLKVAGSFGVLPSTGRTTTQSIPLPLVFEAVTDDPARVTFGAGMGSLEVKERVRLSPDFARFVETLFEASVTLLNVGAIVSSVTEVWSVVDVSAILVLPAWSCTVMLKDTLPKEPEGTCPDTFQTLPSESNGLIVTLVKLLIVTSVVEGVRTDSLVVKVRKTFSPDLAV